MSTFKKGLKRQKLAKTGAKWLKMAAVARRLNTPDYSQMFTEKE